MTLLYMLQIVYVFAYTSKLNVSWGVIATYGDMQACYRKTEALLLATDASRSMVVYHFGSPFFC